MDEEAKEAAILDMLGILLAGERLPRTSAEREYADAQLAQLRDAMLEVVQDCSVQSVAMACRRFKLGIVEGQNPNFMVKPAAFSAEVRRIEDLMISGPSPLQGITEIDYGRGRIRTSHLTASQVDTVMHLKGVLPDGRNMATLGMLELADAVSVLALPSPEPKRPADIVPHLQRFNAEA